MDLHERDASYHRRISIISMMVVVAALAFIVAAAHYIRRANPVMVGWKGEMELLPELVIEPEVVAEQPAPSPRSGQSSPTASIEAARRSEFQVSNPWDATAARNANPDLDVQPRGTADSRAVPMSRPVSYSETYVILKTVKPKYPEHERERGVEGSVTVELLVDEQGLVAQANALSLVGPMSFQDAALEAVRQFVFQPPVVDGEASTMWIKFVFTFRLSG
jgi:protein TonB